MTAVLLWHVQNFVAITSLYAVYWQKEFSTLDLNFMSKSWVEWIKGAHITKKNYHNSNMVEN